MSLSLVSSFASFGSATDENTVWDTKLHEVQAILRQVAIILSFAIRKAVIGTGTQ